MRGPPRALRVPGLREASTGRGLGGGAWDSAWLRGAPRACPPDSQRFGRGRGFDPAWPSSAQDGLAAAFAEKSEAGSAKTRQTSGVERAHVRPRFHPLWAWGRRWRTPSRRPVEETPQTRPAQEPLFREPGPHGLRSCVQLLVAGQTLGRLRRAAAEAPADGGGLRGAADLRFDDRPPPEAVAMESWANLKVAVDRLGSELKQILLVKSDVTMLQKDLTTQEDLWRKAALQGDHRPLTHVGQAFGAKLPRGWSSSAKSRPNSARIFGRALPA